MPAGHARPTDRQICLMPPPSDWLSCEFGPRRLRLRSPREFIRAHRSPAKRGNNRRAQCILTGKPLLPLRSYQAWLFWQSQTGSGCLSIMARRRRVAAAGCLPSEGLSGIEKEMGVAVALGAALEHEPGGVSLLLPADEKSESSGEMRERESVVPSLQPAHPQNPATPAGRREGGWLRAGARSSSESSGPRRVGRSQARDLGTASYAATEAVTIAAAPFTGVQESDRR